MILTPEDIEAAVKNGKVSWTGYREDSHGFYTIPILSPYHYQFAAAIESALLEKLRGGVELPEAVGIVAATPTTGISVGWYPNPGVKHNDKLCTVESAIQYGDARALAAREQAIEECAKVCEVPHRYFKDAKTNLECAKAIRALAASPQEKT